MRRASSSLLPPSFIAASANDSFSAGAGVIAPVRRGLEPGFAAEAAGVLAGDVPPFVAEGAEGFTSSLGVGIAGDAPVALESFVVSIGTSLIGMRTRPRGTYLRTRGCRHAATAKPSARRRALLHHSAL